MKKSTQSVLLAAMLATAGFASAQAPASSPLTRAEVKAQATPIKAGDDGGEGPSAAEKAARGPMDKSRAEVKAQATPMKAGIDGGEGPSAADLATKPAPGDKTRTRAEVRSEININAIKQDALSADRLKAAGVSPPATAAERKAKREAKAMAKPSAGAAPMTEGKAQ